MKKLLYIICIVVFLLLINNLVRSIYSLWQKQDLLTQASRDLEHENAKNASLKGKLREVDQPEFVEREARNKLFLIKPGEQIVLLPREKESSMQAQEEKKEEKIAIWKDWWNLFF